MLNAELHIVLNRRNLEIGQHSSFLQLLNENITKGILKKGDLKGNFINIWKNSNSVQFLNS